MGYQFEFRPIARPFVSALATNHGIWEIRDSIILRLTDETQTVGWGEIAPISWFGSETLEQALDFCRQLPGEITEEIIFSIPDELPACQFGFESAWEMNRQDAKREKDAVTRRVGDAETFSLFPVSPCPRVPVSSSPCPRVPVSPCPVLAYSGLLPAGEAALQAWEKLWKEGYRTFKWKIGVYGMQEELEIFASLTQALPASAKLRLDANGGLSYEEANLWLKTSDINGNIEFIEQPLSVEQFEEMLELSSRYATAIALDESVSTLNQLAACYHQGWREIFVIKPGIAGSPSRLRQFCQQHKIDAVFSSVFETAIGRQAALGLAAELSQHNRAVGFGVNHFFVQEEENWLQNLWKD